MKVIENPNVIKGIALFLAIVVLWMVKFYIQRYFSEKMSNNVQRYHLRKSINIITILIIALAAAIIFSDKVANLSVILGIAGAAIALALQEVIASVAGWMSIVVTTPFKTGDRVKLGGIKGDVIDINILKTTIMEVGDWINGDLYNGRIVRVSNSSLFKEPVFNYSAEFPFLWDEMTFYSTFDSDLELLRETVQSVASDIISSKKDDILASWESMDEKYLISRAEVLPATAIIPQRSCVECILRYTVMYSERRKMKDQIFKEIHKKIEAYGDRIKFV